MHPPASMTAPVGFGSQYFTPHQSAMILMPPSAPLAPPPVAMPPFAHQSAFPILDFGHAPQQLGPYLQVSNALCGEASVSSTTFPQPSQHIPSAPQGAFYPTPLNVDPQQLALLYTQLLASQQPTTLQPYLSSAPPISNGQLGSGNSMDIRYLPDHFPLGSTFQFGGGASFGTVPQPVFAANTAPPPQAEFFVAPAIAELPHADQRLHAPDLNSLPDIMWLPIPNRQVMEATAQRAALDRDGNRPVTIAVGKTCDQSEASDAEQHGPAPRCTVFIGGISIEVARDARVIPWLAAALTRPSIPIRKVVPHKEPRRRQQQAGATVGPPKLSLSAFAVLDLPDSTNLINALHRRALWDHGGCWVARNDAGAIALANYVNAQCTWQRREAAASSGLPRHLLTVELATSTASGSHSARR